MITGVHLFDRLITKNSLIITLTIITVSCDLSLVSVCTKNGFDYIKREKEID